MVIARSICLGLLTLSAAMTVASTPHKLGRPLSKWPTPVYAAHLRR
jgi:hypothetical protein